MNGPLSEHQLAEIKQALYQGQKITAIKLWRTATDAGLADAKSAVEKLESELRAATPEKFTAPPAGKGCLGVVVVALATAGAIFFWVI